MMQALFEDVKAHLQVDNGSCLFVVLHCLFSIYNTSAGGDDGSLGTDPMRILDALRSANDGDGVAVLVDLGSGIMSAETAFELLEDEDIDVRLADAPIVEGAIAASVEAVCGGNIDEVMKAAEDASKMRKTN